MNRIKKLFGNMFSEISPWACVVMLFFAAFCCNILAAVFLTVTGSVTALFIVLLVYIALETLITAPSSELSVVTWIFHILCAGLFFFGVYHQHYLGIDGLIDERNLDGHAQLNVEECTKFWIIPAIKTVGLIVSLIITLMRKDEEKKKNSLE